MAVQACTVQRIYCHLLPLRTPLFRSGLSYCNLLCGVIRGALEMVSLRVKARRFERPTPERAH